MNRPIPIGPNNLPPPPATPPLYAEAVTRASQAMRERRYGEADGICRDILRTAPDHAVALGIRGTVAALEGNAGTALGLLERACSADPSNPAWQSTLSELYRLSNRLDDALARGRQAVRMGPRNVHALISLAKIYVDLGELDESLSVYLAALALEPENPIAHLAIGQILLSRGEFRPGWIEYEWRNKLEQEQGRFPRLRAPQWNGMRLAKGRILLIGDQGFGDTLQFARYIPRVAEKCDEVLLACSQDLLPLLTTVPGAGRTFNQWKDVPSFTAYALLSSLPHVFGTELSTIPRGSAYIAADPSRVLIWRSRLEAAAQPGLRIGVCWAGRPGHPNDARRSMSLSTLLPLAEIPGISLVSLQKDLPSQDKSAFAAAPILDVSSDLTDFGETAALIENLDLVITVDSAVAHLAGAMERKVWMLTPTPADWRWLLNRADTPWYGSMRLFRQSQPGRWDRVMEDVANALAAFAKNEARHST